MVFGYVCYERDVLIPTFVFLITLITKRFNGIRKTQLIHIIRADFARLCNHFETHMTDESRYFYNTVFVFLHYLCPVYIFSLKVIFDSDLFIFFFNSNCKVNSEHPVFRLYKAMEKKMNWVKYVLKRIDTILKLVLTALFYHVC